MLYKGIKVEGICLVVYLKDKAGTSWKENEKYVLNWLNENNIKASVENPIDDLVEIQFDGFDIKTLSTVYKMAKKYFKEVKVNLYLGSKFVEGEGNSIDISLSKFLHLYKSSEAI